MLGTIGLFYIGKYIGLKLTIILKQLQSQFCSNRCTFCGEKQLVIHLELWFGKKINYQLKLLLKLLCKLTKYAKD